MVGVDTTVITHSPNLDRPAFQQPFSSTSDVTSTPPASESLQLWPSVHPVAEQPVHSQLMVALATCHDLTYVDGDLIGDPMDIKMFQSTNWVSGGTLGVICTCSALLSWG